MRKKKHGDNKAVSCEGEERFGKKRRKGRTIGA